MTRDEFERQIERHVAIPSTVTVKDRIVEATATVFGCLIRFTFDPADGECLTCEARRVKECVDEGRAAR